MSIYNWHKWGKMWVKYFYIWYKYCTIWQSIKANIIADSDRKITLYYLIKMGGCESILNYYKLFLESKTYKFYYSVILSFNILFYWFHPYFFCHFCISKRTGIIHSAIRCWSASKSNMGSTIFPLNPRDDNFPISWGLPPQNS